MSGMVDGKWVASMPAAEEIKGGRFVRMDSLFRNAVSADPGAKYPAEAKRYHLWVAWGCPALSNYLRELYLWPGIAETVLLERIKADYFGLANINPSRIVPIGPEVDLTKPHDRERLAGKEIWESDI